MAAKSQSIFLGGLRLLLANKRIVLWSYLPLLLIALSAGTLSRARSGQFLDHSLAAQKLVGDLDIGYFAELFQRSNGSAPNSIDPVQILLYVLFSFFLAAGTVYVFLSREKPRLATVLGVGIQYFWRFFRLTLFLAIFAGPTLGLLRWLRTLYLDRADEKYVEAAYDWRAVLTLLVLLLVAVILRLWFDLAEVYIVHLGLQGDRRVRRSLGPSLRLLYRQFVRVFFTYCAAGAIGVLGFGLFIWLWAGGQTSHLILPVFLISQVGLLCLLASRVWQRAILAALVIETTESAPTVLHVPPVQPGPPDPFTPSPDAPDPEPNPRNDILPLTGLHHSESAG